MKNYRKQKENNKNGHLNDDFAVLARKLRKEKVNKTEMQKIKDETLEVQRKKNKRNRKAIIIQTFFRGYFTRKKFSKVMDKYNTNTIIEYLKKKRIERIKNNYQQIIKYYVYKYIEKETKDKDKLISSYFEYCADIIKSTYKSYKVRQRIKPVRDLFKSKKIIIGKAVFSFKVRLILRTIPIQNILTEIANLKYSLKNMQHDDKLKNDFEQRLPKLLNSFYDLFYKMKNNRSYIETSRVDDSWLLMYMNLINKDNQKYKQIKSATSKKVPIKTYNPSPMNNNLPLDYNDNRNSANTKNDVNLQYEYDNRPLPTSNNVFTEFTIQSDNETQENKGILTPNEMSPKKIKNVDKNPYEEHENKVIKTKKIDYTHLFDDQNQNYGQEDPNEANENKSKPKKRIIKDKPIKPKYDARKAIEEAKKKESEKKENDIDDPKKKDREAFRNFLKEMKKSNKKNNKQNEDIPDKKDKINENKIKNDEEVTIDVKNNKKLKKDTSEISFRKKLHELERSPPQKMNLDKIKSKIGCWAKSPEKKKDTLNNTNNINSNNNTINANNEENGTLHKNQSLNIKRINKVINTITQFDFQKMDTEIRKKIRGRDIFFKEKEEKMKNFKKIPYIKQESAFLTKFNPEDYDNIIKELNNKYEEITNNN